MGSPPCWDPLHLPAPCSRHRRNFHRLRNSSNCERVWNAPCGQAEQVAYARGRQASHAWQARTGVVRGQTGAARENNASHGRQRASKQATLPPVCPRAGKEACVLRLSGARKEPARASRGSFASCQPCAGRRMKRLAARQHATHLAPDSGRQRSRRAGTLQGHERTLAHASRRARQSARPGLGAAPGWTGLRAPAPHRPAEYTGGTATPRTSILPQPGAFSGSGLCTRPRSLHVRAGDGWGNAPMASTATNARICGRMRDRRPARRPRSRPRRSVIAPPRGLLQRRTCFPSGPPRRLCNPLWATCEKRLRYRICFSRYIGHPHTLSTGSSGYSTQTFTRLVPFCLELCAGKVIQFSVFAVWNRLGTGEWKRKIRNGTRAHLFPYILQHFQPTGMGIGKFRKMRGK